MNREQESFLRRIGRAWARRPATRFVDLLGDAAGSQFAKDDDELLERLGVAPTPCPVSKELLRRIQRPIDEPIRTVSEMNQAGIQHWSQRSKRAAEQFGQVQLLANTTWGGSTGANILKSLVPGGEWVAEVEFIRHGPKALDDDNLVTASKHLRDGVASWFGLHIGKARGGLNDSDPRVRWRYSQVSPSPYRMQIHLRVTD